jgi:hypothetical protein
MLAESYDGDFVYGADSFFFQGILEADISRKL